MDVDFERRPNTLGKTTLENGQAAKYRLEHFYKQLVEECTDREQRFNRLTKAFTSSRDGGSTTLVGREKDETFITS